MAIVNEKIKKFSEEKYATKHDVVVEMKTNLIDGIWTQILSYRQQFMKPINLKHIDNTNFSICFTPSINAKLNTIERKLSNLSNKYAKLQRDYNIDNYRLISYRRILKEISKSYRIEAEESVYDNIIRESGNALSYDKVIIQRYFNCLKEIEFNCLKDISADTIGEFYTYLMGTDDLTEYYRTGNYSGSNGEYSYKVLRLGAPPQKIESYIDNLIDFLDYSNNDLDLFAKAVCTFYYIYFVKPFSTYNEEIALLFFKKVLAYNDIEGVAATLNFDCILNCKDEVEKIIQECQANYDLTYLLDFFLTKTDKILANVADEMVFSENLSVKKDLYQPEPTNSSLTKEPLFEKVGITKEELNTVIPTSLEEIQAKKDTLEQENKVQEVEIIAKPVEKEVKIEEKPQENKVDTPRRIEIPELIQNDKELVPQNKTVVFSKNIAISNVPTGLTDEEAMRLENHLMEMNPLITHGQAYFYARHCTIGMYYTVNQYQKEIGCAYETARKSMNDLVVLGYYKKEIMGKKFVYVPIKRN